MICATVLNTGNRRGEQCSRVNCGYHRAPVVNEEQSCIMILKTGLRKGQPCGRMNCKYHNVVFINPDPCTTLVKSGPRKGEMCGRMNCKYHIGREPVPELVVEPVPELVPLECSVVIQFGPRAGEMCGRRKCSYHNKCRVRTRKGHICGRVNCRYHREEEKDEPPRECGICYELETNFMTCRTCANEIGKKCYKRLREKQCPFCRDPLR
jgi:hypothetical protein